MNKYVKIMRLDHWIKQLFILPGCFFGFVLVGVTFDAAMALRFVFGFLSTCFIASANYVINEWLDARFDKYHPVKKSRSVVEEGADPRVIYSLYAALTVAGFACGYLSSLEVLAMVAWLWVMGVLYNVRPFRTKDIAYVDVLTESINNAIRLLIGWFIVVDGFLPPSSLVIGYWFAGAFLMATKRFSEYRMIGDPETAGKYRKSFKHYTERSLLLSAFFYAMASNFFIGVFLVKYRVELILFMPFFMGLFCYYFWIAFQEDSAAQKPEKLFREKGLMLYVVALIAILCVCLFISVPGLEGLLSDQLIAF